MCLATFTICRSCLTQVDAHYYGSLYTVAALDGQTREHIMECLLEVVDDVRNRVVMCVGHNKVSAATARATGRVTRLCCRDAQGQTGRTRPAGLVAKGSAGTWAWSVSSRRPQRVQLGQPSHMRRTSAY